ncbi:hypothetical protein GCM10027035_41110 [Emticicia sediminis]
MSYKNSLIIAFLFIAIFTITCKKVAYLDIIETFDDEYLISDPLVSSIYSTANAIFSFEPIRNPGNKIRGYQGCPSIGYSNGKLFAAWIAGVKDEEWGNYIPVVVSNDMGTTWSKNKYIIGPTTDSVRHFDPSFWNDSFNNLRLSWTASSGMWDGGYGGTWCIRLKEDNNKILTSKPNKLFHGVMNVKPINYGKDSSSIIFPVSGWNINETIYNGNYFHKTKNEWNGVFLYKSNHNFINKSLSIPTKLVKIPTQQPRVHDEAMIVALSNNEMICMFRTLKGLYTSRSKDGGLTWSQQTPFVDLGETTSSRFYFGKLKSGNILLVMNASKNREKLTAFLSTDNARSWPYKLLIDSRSGCSYPDLVQNDAGEICMVHDYARSPKGEIIFTKFTEDDIKSGDYKKVKLTVLSRCSPPINQ